MLSGAVVTVQPLQMSIPHAVHGVPMDRAPVFARPQPFPHEHRPAGLPPGPAAMPILSDGRQPGMAYSYSTKERQTSPPRNQGQQIKKQGNNIQEASCLHPESSQVDRHSIDGTAAANSDADAGQVLTKSMHFQYGFLSIVIQSSSLHSEHFWCESRILETFACACVV